jgi:hypothetical protein
MGRLGSRITVEPLKLPRVAFPDRLGHLPGASMSARQIQALLASEYV